MKPLEITLSSASPTPPELTSEDVLDGGEAIHRFVCKLLGRKQSLATTYYQIAKGAGV